MTTAELWPLYFERFKRDRASAFARIANRTRGTHDTEDLKSEAWFMAIEIGKRRGCPVDLSSPAEQDTVLAWLYKRFVDFVAGKRKESIDQDLDNSHSWHERFAAPEEADPLRQLIRLDDEGTANLPMKGFSQFSAYMILLKRCELNLLKLAAYLAISFVALRKRIEDASDHADRQPSIFDGTEVVDPTFLPRAGRIRRLWDAWRTRANHFTCWLSLRPTAGRMIVQAESGLASPMDQLRLISDDS